MLEAIKLTEEECAIYESDDHATWLEVRREYRRRAVEMTSGRCGTVEIYHCDGTLLDSVGVVADGN